jgi:hypothetical protein
MSRITNLVWSFYHYVAWYGFRKGIILWIREWNSEEKSKLNESQNKSRKWRSNKWVFRKRWLKKK